MKRYFKYSVTPTVGASSAYASGDFVGEVMEIKTGAADTMPATLKTMTIIDDAAQGSALNVIFFSQEPTIASADNAALNLTDANMAYYIGHVAVAAGNYVASASNAAACVKDINLHGLTSSDENGTIYAVIESAGTPTYAATDDLKFTFTFDLD